MQVKEARFSIAANVCAVDSAIILHTVPNWLRVFADKLLEILLVVDEEPSTGRMAAHHQQRYTNRDLYAAIDQLKDLDPRIRSTVLDYTRARDLSLKWFSEPDVVRCQSGSPTFGYTYAIEQASSEIILRLDCDMLFYDSGWLTTAIELLESESFDLLEPPKMGMDVHGYKNTISTGAFMLKRSSFVSRCLPLKAHRLDWLRRFHRALKRRPTFLSLEEIFKKEKERGRIKHTLLDSNLGCSIHVYTRDYAYAEHLDQIIAKIESGLIPDEQVAHGWNLTLEVWPPPSEPSVPGRLSP
jgi:glycosyltransferase involved in cell wall biosynthesis